jgi:hypothetical protein
VPGAGKCPTCKNTFAKAYAFNRGCSDEPAASTNAQKHVLQMAALRPLLNLAEQELAKSGVTADPEEAVDELFRLVPYYSARAGLAGRVLALLDVVVTKLKKKKARLSELLNGGLTRPHASLVGCILWRRPARREVL